MSKRELGTCACGIDMVPGTQCPRCRIFDTRCPRCNEWFSLHDLARLDECPTEETT